MMEDKDYGLSNKWMAFPKLWLLYAAGGAMPEKASVVPCVEIGKHEVAGSVTVPGCSRTLATTCSLSFAPGSCHEGESCMMMHAQLRSGIKLESLDAYRKAYEVVKKRMLDACEIVVLSFYACNKIVHAGGHFKGSSVLDNKLKHEMLTFSKAGSSMHCNCGFVEVPWAKCDECIELSREQAVDALVDATKSNAVSFGIGGTCSEIVHRGETLESLAIGHDLTN